jgi:hypothetical protein
MFLVLLHLLDCSPLHRDGDGATGAGVEPVQHDAIGSENRDEDEGE